MSPVIDQIEEHFKSNEVRYRRRDDEIEITYFGYPVAERYRIVYLEKSDAVLISSHGIVYPQSEREDSIAKTVLSWNHDNFGACWSYDRDQRAICADTTLYLAGEPLVVTQFARYYNALVDQVRRKLPELLRAVVEEPPSKLDPNVQAQLEQILKERDSETPGDETPPEPDLPQDDAP